MKLEEMKSSLRSRSLYQFNGLTRIDIPDKVLKACANKKITAIGVDEMHPLLADRTYTIAFVQEDITSSDVEYFKITEGLVGYSKHVSICTKDIQDIIIDNQLQFIFDAEYIFEVRYSCIAGVDYPAAVLSSLKEFYIVTKKSMCYGIVIINNVVREIKHYTYNDTDNPFLTCINIHNINKKMRINKLQTISLDTSKIDVSGKPI